MGGKNFLVKIVYASTAKFSGNKFSEIKFSVSATDSTRILTALIHIPKCSHATIFKQLGSSKSKSFETCVIH